MDYSFTNQTTGKDVTVDIHTGQVQGGQAALEDFLTMTSSPTATTTTDYTYVNTYGYAIMAVGAVFGVSLAWWMGK